MNTDNRHNMPLLTVLCISPGTVKELSALITEFNKQDYASSQRELIIIDDGPWSQQSALTGFLSSVGMDTAVRYQHSPQRLLAEEKVRLGVEQATGEYFHFMTVNTYYPVDYFTRAVNSVQRAAEKISGTTHETLWLSPLERLCTRQTRIPQYYSALNTLCCHRSIIEQCPFLLAANGREASFTCEFSTPDNSDTPVVQCHDIEEIIRQGLLINTVAVSRRLPEGLHSPAQPQTVPDWGFFDKIACINLHQQPEHLQAFLARLTALQVPQQKIQLFAAGQSGNRAIRRLAAQLDVLKTARAGQWENVLILEDDIHFVKQNSIMKAVNNFLFSLGAGAWNAAVFSAQYHDVCSLKSIKNIVIVRNASAIGAWAVNKGYFDTLINFFEQLLSLFSSQEMTGQKHTDSYWQQLMCNDSWLGMWPPLCFPSAPPDEVKNTVADNVPLFFLPLLAIDHHAKDLAEGPLLDKVKRPEVTPEVFTELSALNNKLHRYELENYYSVKALNRLPEVRIDSTWPLLSVIISAYNQVYNLKVTLESIFFQSYPNLEIVVADDCSTDGTQAYMETVIDPRCHYVRHRANLGAASNVKIVFEQHIFGEYVFFIDHDDLLVDRHYLWDAVQILQNDKNLSLVFSNYYNWHEASHAITPSHPGPHTNKINGKEYFLNYGQGLRNPQSLVTVCRFRHLVQAQSLYFNCHTNVGDLHIHTRIMLFGDVAFLPVLTAIYRIHEKSMTFNLSDDGDIRPDIAFMQDIEKTRSIAIQQGVGEEVLQYWFARISINHFANWRLPIAINQGKYSCTLSILAWMNKYYPDIGRAILTQLLVKK